MTPYDIRHQFPTEAVKLRSVDHKFSNTEEFLDYIAQGLLNSRRMLLSNYIDGELVNTNAADAHESPSNSYISAV